jgi:hypothetical protein
MSTWAVGEQRISYWRTQDNEDKIVKAMSRRLKQSITAKKQREKVGMDVECPSLVTEPYQGWDWYSNPPRQNSGGYAKLMTGGYVFSSREQQAMQRGGNKELEDMIKSKDLRLLVEGLTQMLTMLGEEVVDSGHTKLSGQRAYITTKRAQIDLRVI